MLGNEKQRSGAARDFASAARDLRIAMEKKNQETDKLLDSLLDLSATAVGTAISPTDEGRNELIIKGVTFIKELISEKEEKSSEKPSRKSYTPLKDENEGFRKRISKEKDQKKSGQCCIL